MARLAYVVLAHEPASQVSELVKILLAADSDARVIVHYDARSKKTEYDTLLKFFAEEPRAHFVVNRVVGKWGEFGLVDGVVHALHLLRERDIECDYVYLLSGSCMPARPICELKLFLDQRPGMEFIESNRDDWIVAGLRDERYHFYHFFNQRDQSKRFTWNWKIQKAFGVKRQFPVGLQPRFGSQWWCLTRKTCMEVLDYIDEHPPHYHFFKSTWIPDELFFQTLVNKIVASDRIFNNSLTYFKFSSKGKPLIFYDDHIGALDDIPYFFVRKIGANAVGLRRHLAAIAARKDPGPLPRVGSGKGLFDYDRRVASQIDLPRPGQMFYGWQKFEGWPASAAALRRPFAVLYGPPSITRIARNALIGAPGVTALGHLFRPGNIDFGAQIRSLKGLKRKDVEIRDYDPPLYLTRVIERCEGFPVLELAPGENWPFEAALPKLECAVTIPCLPRLFGIADWMRLFWALAVFSSRDAEKLPSEPSPRSEDSFFPFVRGRVDRRIDQFANKDHQDHTFHHFVTTTKETNIPIYWSQRAGSAASTFAYRARKRPQALLSSIGSAASPLIPQFATMQAALSCVAFDDIVEPLPERWRQFFQTALGNAPRPATQSRLLTVADAGEGEV